MKGLEDLPQPRLQIADGPFERVDVPEVQLEHEAVMLANAPMKRFKQAFWAGLQAALGELEKLPRV